MWLRGMISFDFSEDNSGERIEDGFNGEDSGFVRKRYKSVGRVRHTPLDSSKTAGRALAEGGGGKTVRGLAMPVI